MFRFQEFFTVSYTSVNILVCDHWFMWAGIFLTVHVKVTLLIQCIFFQLMLSITRSIHGHIHFQFYQILSNCSRRFLSILKQYSYIDSRYFNIFQFQLSIFSKMFPNQSFVYFDFSWLSPLFLFFFFFLIDLNVILRTLLAISMQLLSPTLKHNIGYLSPEH